MIFAASDFRCLARTYGVIMRDCLIENCVSNAKVDVLYMYLTGCFYFCPQRQ